MIIMTKENDWKHSVRKIASDILCSIVRLAILKLWVACTKMWALLKFESNLANFESNYINHDYDNNYDYYHYQRSLSWSLSWWPNIDIAIARYCLYCCCSKVVESFKWKSMSIIFNCESIGWLSMLRSYLLTFPPFQLLHVCLVRHICEQ